MTTVSEQLRDYSLDVRVLYVSVLAAGLGAVSSVLAWALLELIALAGFLFFSVVWLIVAVATPAPVVVADVARIQARRIQERLMK